MVTYKQGTWSCYRSIKNGYIHFKSGILESNKSASRYICFYRKYTHNVGHYSKCIFENGTCNQDKVIKFLKCRIECIMMRLVQLSIHACSITVQMIISNQWRLRNIAKKKIYPNEKNVKEKRDFVNKGLSFKWYIHLMPSWVAKEYVASESN